MIALEFQREPFTMVTQRGIYGFLKINVYLEIVKMGRRSIILKLVTASGRENYGGLFKKTYGPHK